MGALKDLFNSERGLLAVLILVGATVFVILGKMAVPEWETFSEVIFGAYVGGKTITGAIGMLTGNGNKAGDAPAAPAALPAAPAPAPTPAPAEPAK